MRTKSLGADEGAELTRQRREVAELRAGVEKRFLW